MVDGRLRGAGGGWDGRAKSGRGKLAKARENGGGRTCWSQRKWRQWGERKTVATAGMTNPSAHGEVVAGRGGEGTRVGEDIC